MGFYEACLFLSPFCVVAGSGGAFLLPVSLRPPFSQVIFPPYQLVGETMIQSGSRKSDSPCPLVSLPSSPQYSVGFICWSPLATHPAQVGLRGVCM